MNRERDLSKQVAEAKGWRFVTDGMGTPKNGTCRDIVPEYATPAWCWELEGDIVAQGCSPAWAIRPSRIRRRPDAFNDRYTLMVYPPESDSPLTFTGDSRAECVMLAWLAVELVG